MAGIGETVAALNRLSKTAKRPSRTRRPARLSEIASFGPNPGDLRAFVYRPQDLGSNAPLVVVLHGCTQGAEDYAAGSGWLALADRYGFAVLCPQQRQANNANLCFNWFEREDVTRGSGEVASIRQMIAHVTDLHRLDAGRVFITGLSAGGAMTSAMLAAYPEVFAGGAIVAGLPYGAAESVQDAFRAMFQPAGRTGQAWGDLVRAASAHPGPWPKVSVWHGGGDATVKSANGQAVAEQWADVHGAVQAQTHSFGGRRRQTWTNAAGEVVVEHHLIDGMAHGAPLAVGGEEGCGVAGPFLIEAGISSSLEITRFWGIAPQTAASAVAEERFQLEPDQDRTPEPKPSGFGGIDVQDVITRALTSAGLMR